jgi:alpha-tubulin suppressor-like RCC1 family protein
LDVVLVSHRIAAVAALLALVACGGDPVGSPAITSVEFDIDAVTLLIDDEVSTQVVVRNSNGETVTDQTVSYRSSAGFIASVDATGTIRAVAAGTATITAKVGNVTDQVSVTVNWPPVQNVDLGLANPDLFVEDTTPTTITVLNSKGNPASNAAVIYTTSDASIATVDALGRIVGVGDGSATITATAEGISDQVAVTVTWPPVVNVAFTRDTATLLLDDSLATSVVVMNSRGRVARNAVVTYGTSAGGTATIGADGKIRTLATGTATLSATVGSFHDEIGLTVVPHFTSMGMGEIHTCGVSGVGGLWCWGSDAARQLGQSEQAICRVVSQCSLVPIRVQGTQKFVSVTGGAWHTCALTDTGAAYCWGMNSHAQIGNGATGRGPFTAPTLVSGGLTFTSITAGRWHTCGITTANEAYCWGFDNHGELGTGTPPTARCDDGFALIPCSRVPAKVVGNLTWVSLEAREGTTCGYTSAQTIYCWGKDVGGTESNECQNAFPTNICTRTPLLQHGGATYAGLDVTGGMICGRTAPGGLTCTGFSHFGEFGNGVASTNTATPLAVAGGATFAQAALGRIHICARVADNTVQCWGGGDYGSGEGGVANTLTPTTIAGGIAFSTLFGSPQAGHTCGLSTAGRAYCWGDGRFGQLGDNAALTRFQPVLVKLAR